MAGSVTRWRREMPGSKSPALRSTLPSRTSANHDAELRTGIDLAYRVKYGRGTAVDQMITDDAAASTLRIVPNQ
jgi:hypothetical protein